MCKALHVLPRSGGVLDQPAPEVLRLEKALDAFARYEERESKKSEARNKNRDRHRTVPS